MDWCAVDERLIRRGELLLSLDFLNNYDYELSLLNDGKVGRPFKITYGYIVFLAVVRYLFSMPYRRIEGFTRALHRLIPSLPSLRSRVRIPAAAPSPLVLVRVSPG